MRVTAAVMSIALLGGACGSHFVAKDAPQHGLNAIASPATTAPPPTTTTVPPVTTTTDPPTTTTVPPNTTSVPPTTTTTVPPVTTTTVPPTTTTAPPATTTTEASSTTGAAPGENTCAWALQYLDANANPEFIFECPAYADGQQAETCENDPPACPAYPAPGWAVIKIQDVCFASVANEAWNSWHIASGGPFDPYGYCSS
jgi:cytoskeletal protein RodZ